MNSEEGSNNWVKKAYVCEKAHAEHPIGPKGKGIPRPNSSHVCQRDLLNGNWNLEVWKPLGYHVNKERQSQEKEKKE